jgi:histone acetyltransferase (RNA polymerase elongator complex component)
MIRKKIIPIFIPFFGCPHQCVFCNQVEITDFRENRVTTDDVDYKIQTYLNHPTVKENPVSFEVAFYGGTFTGLSLEMQRQLLEPVQKYLAAGQITRIRLSTKPDFIDSSRLELLKQYRVGTVELGVQSLVPEVLRKAGRGHSMEDVMRAVTLLRGEGFQIGLQMMVGLPGDTPDTVRTTVTRILQLQPDFVRVYPTVVLKDTPLERLYQRGRFQPFSLPQTVEICKEIWWTFYNQGIPIIRMGLQHSGEMESKVIAGPYHPAFGHLVESAIMYDRMCKRYQDEVFKERTKSKNEAKGHEAERPLSPQGVTFLVSPTDVSNLRGQKNENIRKFKQQFSVSIVSVKVCEDLTKGELLIEGFGG